MHGLTDTATALCVGIRSEGQYSSFSDQRRSDEVSLYSILPSTEDYSTFIVHISRLITTRYLTFFSEDFHGLTQDTLHISTAKRWDASQKWNITFADVFKCDSFLLGSTGSPSKLKDERKYKDMVDFLEEYKKYVPSTTVKLLEPIPGSGTDIAEDRSYITTLVGGDYLPVACARGAQQILNWKSIGWMECFPLQKIGMPDRGNCPFCNYRL